MNIIIKADKSVRITQYDATDSTPIDIQNITVHADPSLTPSALILTYKEVIGEGHDIDFKIYRHTGALSEMEDCLTPNYIDYVCSSQSKIITRPYDVQINVDGTNIPVTQNVVITNDYLQDEHPPIIINTNRKISDMANNTILQEDSLSEVIRFSINEFYDGVSFLDETKVRETTYAVPTKAKVRLVNRETGEVKEQEIFMGDFPLMTESGTFIINQREMRNFYQICLLVVKKI